MSLGSLLVTGAGGFVGQALIPHFANRGWRVTGLVHPSDKLAHGAGTFAADLCVKGALEGLSREWDAVIHLAAISVPSEVEGEGVFTNARMTANLLDHLVRGRVIVVSSCLVYAPSDGPLTEEAPMVPQGRYGLSKALVEALVPHYRRRLDVRVARPFNHLGRGMPPKLMLPTLVRRVAELPEGASELLMNGYNSTRDFIDVRDVISAYDAILAYGKSEPYCFNVCTGVGHSVEDLARGLLRLANRPCSVRFGATATSSDDVRHVVGDHTRLSNCTGWTPRHSIEESLLEIWA